MPLQDEEPARRNASDTEPPLFALPEEDDVADGSLPEEDDDNPYQESDEALPDDLEEAVLRKDPSKEGSRFGEV